MFINNSLNELSRFFLLFRINKNVSSNKGQYLISKMTQCWFYVMKWTIFMTGSLYIWILLSDKFIFFEDDILIYLIILSLYLLNGILSMILFYISCGNAITKSNKDFEIESGLKKIYKENESKISLS